MRSSLSPHQVLIELFNLHVEEKGEAPTHQGSERHVVVTSGPWTVACMLSMRGARHPNLGTTVQRAYHLQDTHPDGHQIWGH